MAKDELVPYDPNEGADSAFGMSKAWPINKHAYDVDSYVQGMMIETPGSLESFAKSITSAVKKGTALPPTMQSFATISMMPDIHTNGGVIQVPGIPPEALRKIARENVAPQMIISLRVSDIQRYANQSTHPWKPGWRIEMRKQLKNPSSSELQDICDAENFIQNCNAEYGTDARKRDAAQITNFSTFLTQIVTDTLIFDGIAIWTDMNLKGEIKAFKALSTFNIRLTTKQGYQGNRDIFAVAVDEAGTIVAKFTRDDLVFAVRNARADADISGYGWPEIEQAIRAIQGTTNALDTAVDKFNRNAIPNGILKARGMWTQRQLDVLGRLWANLKKGVTKEWALPVIPLPKDGDLELMDMVALKGDDMRNQDLFNLLSGVLCSLYKFPIERLHYRSSGAGPDTKPEPATSGAQLTDTYDPGLAPLLMTIENIINEYLIWPRWKHLNFHFCGKNPKEEARELEARTHSMTFGERRASTDLPTLESLAKGSEEKMLARIMALAPIDPNLAGVFQNLASALIAAITGGTKEGDGTGGPEGMMTSKKDPAVSQAHGHLAGVRRDSAGESGE